MKITDVNLLMDQTRALEKTEDNKSRSNLWKPTSNSAEAYWHGRPKDGLNFVPFTIEPEHEMWGKILGFDLDRYYTDGKTYLQADLNMKIYRFENFPDGTPVGRSISIWMGVGFEAALFGVEQKYTRDKDPWLGREPILKNKKDLDGLPVPDFYKNRAMAVAHQMYSDMRALLDDDFTIVMHEWCRGPFGVACHLRGMDQIVVDMIEDPQFVHTLMRFLNDARKKWTEQRAKFMKVPILPSSLYNDEVNVPLLSPKLYEKFVLPYETELSEFYGGITYWHSCGNTAPLQQLIKSIPRLEMIHISPWTSIEQSIGNLRDSGIALEVALHPFKDVQSATAQQITSHLTSIRKATERLPVTVRADGLQVLSSVEGDEKKIKEWAEIANSVLMNGRRK